MGRPGGWRSFTRTGQSLRVHPWTSSSLGTFSYLLSFSVCAAVYSDGGGGGERVLWVLVKALLSSGSEHGPDRDQLKDQSRTKSFAEEHNLEIVIYSGDRGLTSSALLEHVQVSARP